LGFFSNCAYNHFDLNSISDGNLKKIHIMKNGETLWRISKKYNVPVDEIIRYNNIEDVTDIPVGKKIYIPENPSKQKKYGEQTPNFIWPLKGVISKGFKVEGTIKHAGIDILSPEGIPIVAAAAGRVIYNGDQMTGYGNLIIIKHSNNFSTVYAHNKINFKPELSLRKFINRRYEDLKSEIVKDEITEDVTHIDKEQSPIKSTETESHRHQAGFGETGLCPSDCHRLLLIA